MRLEVYVEKNGRQTLIGDSEAEEGSKLRETLDSILKGEYKASKGTYYFKVSRDDTVKESDQMSYAMQIMQGTTYKHDYVLTESSSQDTKNKTLPGFPQPAATELCQASMLCRFRPPVIRQRRRCCRSAI